MIELSIERVIENTRRYIVICTIDTLLSILFLYVCIETTKTIVEGVTIDLCRSVNTLRLSRDLNVRHFSLPDCLSYVTTKHDYPKNEREKYRKRRYNVSTEEFESVIPVTPFLWRR